MKTILLSLLIAGSVFAQKVVELKLPNSNKVVVKLMFRNGSICDPAGKEGVTFMTAHLVAQGGTADMTYSEIQDFIYPMAAEYGAFVDKEESIFTFAVPVDFLDEFYPVLKGLLLTPAFAEADFSRVKKNQQNYVDQIIRASSDEEYSKKALEDLLFRGTNYQHMKQGKSASVQSITLDEVKQQYKTYFTKNNLMIGITGNYTDKFLQTLKTDMAKLSANKPDIPVPGKARMPDGIRVEIISKENAFGSAIFTGFPLNLTRSNDEFAAMMVANSWFGEHRKSYSHLYQKIRQQRSMNYGDYSYIEWYESGGQNMLPPPGVPRSSNYFSIWIRPVQIAKQLNMQYEELSDISIGHAHFALRMAIHELDNLIKNGLSDEEFEATLTFLQSYIKLYTQTPEKQLGFLMDSKYYGRNDYIKELSALLAKLTREDVNRAIKKYWQVDNMFVTIVTDKSEAEPLAESLKNNTPSAMSYSNLVKEGLPKEILDEDEEVANYKLNVKSVKIVDSADTFK
jgi:zinc protease